MRQIRLKLTANLRDYKEFGFKTIVFTSKGEMHRDIYNLNDLKDYYEALYYRV